MIFIKINMEKQYYDGYFCKKCSSIPLIQIIPKINNSKIFSSCKCFKHYQTIDNFIKCNYHKNIDINNISNNSHNKYFENKDSKYNEKIDINLIINNLNKTKEKIEKESNEIKNKIIEIFQKKIDEIKELYKNYIATNNKIILVLEEIIKSYQLIKDNQSNFLNLLNNFAINDLSRTDIDFYKSSSLDIIFNKTKNYFDNGLIISDSNLIKKYENKIVSYHPFKAKCFIELDNYICASCLDFSNSIALYDLNNLSSNSILFQAHSKTVNWIIKSNKNNIISCGDDGLIKIWPIITDSYINQQQKLDNLGNKMRFFNYSININANLIPIYEYQFENLKLVKIKKMIHLKGNKFLVISEGNILIFQYNINENKSKIDLIKSCDEHQLIDAILILKENFEIIATYNEDTLIFLNIPDLEPINKKNIRITDRNSLVQLNSNELLIDTFMSFKILDINNFKIKLIIKKLEGSQFLLNLNDGTIIQSNTNGIKRFLIRTMEELPHLNYINDDDYDYFSERIVYMYKLKDGKFILCHSNGKIEICNLKFI